ncbi:MAG: hypothetical protein HKM05_08925 [Spirochaetales bacterium]|nr:hypothetical protein [Spirochaetales bacterium]
MKTVVASAIILISFFFVSFSSKSTLALASLPPAPSASNTGPSWWTKNTVFYQIWVSAFQNGAHLGQTPSGNTGNLKGITAAIQNGYFTKLGVNALWLSPIFAASSLTPYSANKHGYDTLDYGKVAGIYGNAQDLRDLIAAAHERRIRVIFDFVPNHTSNECPWFTDSESSLTSAHRNWYIWHTQPAPDAPGPTFNGASGWHIPSGIAVPGYTYYGIFGKGMPDLNYANPEVSRTMRQVVRNTLSWGFDGMRVDAARYLFEGKEPGTYADQPATHQWFDQLRKLLGSFPSRQSKMMMAEVWGYGPGATQLSIDKTYLNYRGDSEFQAVLDFIWPTTVVQALKEGGQDGVMALQQHIVDDTQALIPTGGVFATFLSNHDLAASRPVTSFGGKGPQLYLATALTTLGPWIPIVYYGNEIAMPGSVNGPDSNMRQPFDWTSEQNLVNTPNSLWNWQAILDRLRSEYGAWVNPKAYAVNTSDQNILAFEIVSGSGNKSALITANLSPTAKSFSLPLSVSATGLLGDTSKDVVRGGRLTIHQLPPDGLRVWALNDTQAVSFFSHDVHPISYNPQLALPAPEQLYWRGTVNGWGANAGNLMTRQGKVYSLTVSLTSGVMVQFKFADSGWGSYNYGWNNCSWDAAHAIPPGATAGSLGNGVYANITFIPGTTGDYTFHFEYGPNALWYVTQN